MLAGAVAGAAVTLLRTPVSGRELRGRIRRKAEQIVPGGKLPSVSPELRERIRDTGTQIREQATSATAGIQDRSREALTAGREKAASAGTRVQSRSREAFATGREKAGTATATVTQRVQQIKKSKSPEADSSGISTRQFNGLSAPETNEITGRTVRSPGDG
jgi:gas vesicle protein